MKVEQKLMKKIYSENIEKEWKRLVKSPFHRLEFDVTMYFLRKNLPKKGLILDAGGGPGRYTIELAKLGYEVILLDITPDNLSFAKKRIARLQSKKNVRDIVEGSITNLSKFESNSFNAVICLGSSLSHLHKKEREKAISELIRVAKKKAPIFISVMGRYGHLMRIFEKWNDEIKKKSYLDIALNGDDASWGGKSYFHYFTLEEFEKLFDRNKIKVIKKIGLEGLASSHEKNINKIAKDKKSWNNWMQIHNKLATRPTIIDISVHMMIIGRKK